MTTTALDAPAGAPPAALNSGTPSSPPPSSADNPSGLSPISPEKKPKKKKKKKVRKPEELVSGTTDEAGKPDGSVPSTANVPTPSALAEAPVPPASAHEAPADDGALIAEGTRDAAGSGNVAPDIDAGSTAGADNAESTVAVGGDAGGEESLDVWKARATQSAGVISDLKATSAKLRADLSVATQRATDAEAQEKTAKEGLADATSLLKEKESALEAATQRASDAEAQVKTEKEGLADAASLLEEKESALSAATQRATDAETQAKTAKEGLADATSLLKEKESALEAATLGSETAVQEKESAVEQAKLRSDTALKEKESALEEAFRSEKALKDEVAKLLDEKKKSEQGAVDGEALDDKLTKERVSREESEKKLAEAQDALVLARVAQREGEAARVRATEEADTLRKELESEREAATAAAAAAASAAASAEASAASAADAGGKTVVEDASGLGLDNRAVAASSGAAAGLVFSFVLRAVFGGGGRRND